MPGVPGERQPYEQMEPRRRWLLWLWWTLFPIMAVVLLAVAVNAPILLIPVVALLAFVWRRRERWHWSGTGRWSESGRTTTIAILLVVLAAFLIQRLAD